MNPTREAARFVRPGPEDPSVLYLQNVHVSEDVWQKAGLGDEEKVLRPRRISKATFDYPPVAIVPLLMTSGFYGAARAGYFPYDHHLVTAMVDRWRPETHTFHMPMGECTITLQDVAIQIGLPVDGEAVIGQTHMDWGALCDRLLGRTPPRSSLSGMKLKLSWLETILSPFPQDPTQEQLEQLTRAYILRLIGGFLMPDTSGNKVSLMYLPLLEDLTRAGTYSWGSAVLAFLFRELCEATRCDAVNIGGCMHLLHVWVWDRFPCLAPSRKRRNPRRLSVEDEEEAYPIPPPLGARWSDYKELNESPMHLVGKYRGLLDRLSERHIVWQPYVPGVCLDHIPDYCLLGSDIWQAQVPLICFHIIEWHQTDRVLRQFGLAQHIPREAINLDNEHTRKLTNLTQVNWSRQHAIFLELWGQRRQRIVNSGVPAQVFSRDADYSVWYKGITRKWMDPDSGIISIAAENFEALQQANNMEEMQEMCRRMTQMLSIYEAAPPEVGVGTVGDVQHFPYPQTNVPGPSRGRMRFMSQEHPRVKRLLSDDEGEAGDEGGGNGGEDATFDDEYDGSGGVDLDINTDDFFGDFPETMTAVTPPPYDPTQPESSAEPSNRQSARRPRDFQDDTSPMDVRRRGRRQRRGTRCGTGSHLLRDD